MPARTLRILVVLSAIAALSLLACGATGGALPAAAPPVAEMARDLGAPEAVVSSTVVASFAEPPSGSGEPSELPAQQAVDDRMIIRTADVSGKVADVQVAVAQVRGLAEAAGGYLVEQRVWTEGDELRAQLIIRVPAQKFDALLEQVTGVTTEILSSSVYGQDITEEYYDLESRLKALRATEEQLLLLLDDVRESMKQAEDILAVYRELQNIQIQIEQLAGRQQYLERMVAMSTINLSLVPVAAKLPVVVGGWRPLDTARGALRSLSGAVQGLVNLAIWLLLFVVPILLVLAVPVAVLLFVLRAITRRRRARKVVQSESPPTAS